MTKEEHRQRHIELHRAFDELLADWILHTPTGYENTSKSVLELIQWSHTQTIEPTESEDDTTHR